MTFLKNEGVEIVQDSENRLTVTKMLHKPREEVHTSQHRTEKQIQCGRGGEEDPRKVMNKPNRLCCGSFTAQLPGIVIQRLSSGSQVTITSQRFSGLRENPFPG